MMGSKTKIVGRKAWELDVPCVSNGPLSDPASRSCQRMKVFLHQVKHMVECTEHALTEFIEVQKMESIGVLAQGLAHDLKNLLVVIQANAFKINKIAGDKTEVANSCKNILEIGERVGDLLEKLFLLGSEDGLKESLELDLAKEIPGCLQPYVSTLPENIELIYQAVDDSLLVSLALDELWRILSNLLNNAVEAMKDGGKITVTVRGERIGAGYCRCHGNAYPGLFAVLKIEDNGRGIPPPYRSKIFYPLFTTKGSETTRGWGLSIVYSIVKNRNGWIDVVSECNRGTTFEVFLPLKAI